MSSTVVSRNGVSIRLTDERWTHIAEQHGELADLQTDVLDVVANPERILAGGEEELLAIRAISTGKWLVVVYREIDTDGFIITAFVTRRIRSLSRRRQVWP